MTEEKKEMFLEKVIKTLLGRLSVFAIIWCIFILLGYKYYSLFFSEFVASRTINIDYLFVVSILGYIVSYFVLTGFYKLLKKHGIKSYFISVLIVIILSPLTGYVSCFIYTFIFPLRSYPSYIDF